MILPDGMILPRIVNRAHLGLPDAYIVESDDLFRTFMPWTVQPLTETMVSSGFMDDRGRVHYEFNHNLYDPRKYMNWRSLLRPKIYYEALVKDFLGTSLLKDEKRLISGGHFVYDFRKKENYLMNLVILPRRLVSDMDETIRKKAIFIFQESFDRLTARLGGDYERTATLVIPDEKMKELGYERYRSRSLRESWDHIKEWWPISLRGLQRQYIKRIGPSSD